jgi:hypothetical protein
MKSVRNTVTFAVTQWRHESTKNLRERHQPNRIPDLPLPFALRSAERMLRFSSQAPRREPVECSRSTSGFQRGLREAEAESL